MSDKPTIRDTEKRQPSKRRQVGVPPRDYQPTKAETEQEYDMPGADIVTVRNAFFRRERVRKEPPETD